MNNNRQTEQQYLGFAAILFGIGMIIFDCITSKFTAVMDPVPFWVLYLPLFMLSVWGLMKILTNRDLKEISNKKSSRINKHTFYLPTEGVFFLMIMFLILLASIFGKSNMLLLIFSLMAGPFVVNGWITFMMLKKLNIKRELPSMVMAGSSFSVVVHVHNQRWLIPSYLLTVRDTVRSNHEILRPEILYARIPCQQERNTPYQLLLANRGVYEFGPIEILTRFPLGFVERGYVFKIQDSIIVYPRIGHLSSYWKRDVRKNQQSEMQQRRQTGSFEDEFHHIREYRNGDDPRSIHWRTSARYNELMVKEYRKSRDRDMLLLLDLWTPDRPSESDFLLQEHAVSLAATIALEQIRLTGESSLHIHAEGNKSTTWANHNGAGSANSMLEFFALLEAGKANGTNQMLLDAAQHRYAHHRIIFISTRHDIKNGFTHSNFYDAYKKLSTSSDGLQLLDPDPLLTSAYYQYNYQSS